MVVTGGRVGGSSWGVLPAGARCAQALLCRAEFYRRLVEIFLRKRLQLQAHCKRHSVAMGNCSTVSSHAKVEPLFPDLTSHRDSGSTSWWNRYGTCDTS